MRVGIVHIAQSIFRTGKVLKPVEDETFVSPPEGVRPFYTVWDGTEEDVGAPAHVVWYNVDQTDFEMHLKWMDRKHRDVGEAYALDQATFEVYRAELESGKTLGDIVDKGAA